jgi:Flp pilus assembly protein TadG
MRSPATHRTLARTRSAAARTGTWLAQAQTRTATALARARQRGDDRGATAIEWAIFALLAIAIAGLVAGAVAVMAVIFTAIQASTWVWARSIALAAAQEGADAQRAYNATPGAGQARAQAFITSTKDGLNDARINVATTPGGVHVTVTGHCLTVLPGFCNAFPVSATVHGTTEQVTSP